MIEQKYPEDFTEPEKRFSEFFKEAVEGSEFEDMFPLPPFEQILARAEQRKQEQKRRWRNRIASAACILLTLAVGSGAIALWLNSDQATAAKFNWEKFLHASEGGGLSTSMEGGDGESSVTIQYTSMDDWEDAKRFLPQLCRPGYIPEGYTLEAFSVTKIKNGTYSAEYSFCAEEGQLHIDMTGGFDEDSTLYIEGSTEETSFEQGKPFLVTSDINGKLAACIPIENGIISITADSLTESELMKIAEQVEW